MPIRLPFLSGRRGGAVGPTAWRESALPALTDPLLRSIRSRFEAHYLERFGMRSGRGLYQNEDWRRLQFAADLIPDGAVSVLDVGVGPGAFLNYLTLSNRFERVTGIDKARYSKFLGLTPTLDYRIGNVAAMPFPDKSFDVVFCMEVLEHLDDETLVRGLAELRRVAARRLVMSVPFDQPLPLPTYHLQHFDAPRMTTTFPDARVVLLSRSRWYRPTWPWAVLIEER